MFSKSSSALTQTALNKAAEEVKTPPNDWRNKEFIQEVITLAKQSFITGSDVSKSIKTKIAAGTMQDALGRDYTDAKFPTVIDRDYTGYDAISIKGSSYIACEGPTNYSVDKFITKVLLNKKYPPQRIIVLGTCLKETIGQSGDFYDYCIVPTSQKPRKYATASIFVHDHNGKHCVMQSGQVGFDELFTTEITASYGSQRSKMKVTIIPLADNRTFQLSAAAEQKKVDFWDKKTPTREEMWQLFKETHNGYTVVHCSAGIGRTGHLVMTFEILKNFKRIFNYANPQICAENIVGLLKKLRYNRPCLVNTENQFIHAIENAVTLHNYALEKAYNLEPYISNAELNSEKEIQPLTEPESSPGISYTELFKHLQFNQHDRQIAIEIFKKQLESTTSPIAIQNLLSAAKPYINVHRHARFDSWFHLENTNTWKAMIKLGRLRALSMLPTIIKYKSSEEAIDYLADTSKLAIFSQHRNNSVFFGAFGKTKAQKEINNIITEFGLPKRILA